MFFNRSCIHDHDLHQGSMNPGYHFQWVSNRCDRSWINREQQGSRSWIQQLSRSRTGPVPTHCLLQTSSTAQVKNPNSPIGDFDYDSESWTSHPTAVERDSSHQTLSTSDTSMGHQQMLTSWHLILMEEVLLESGLQPTHPYIISICGGDHSATQVHSPHQGE